jgi:nicotinamide mononucleotide (NMN) deamidase PncC
MELAQTIAHELIEREWQIGAVECGVDGVVSHSIFETDDGPAVLGYSLVVDDLQEAIELLNLPRPQLRNAGDFSLKAARAAAREGIAFLGVNLCLVAWGEEFTLDETERRPVHLAVATSREVLDETIHIGGEEGEREIAARQIVTAVLRMAREMLVKTAKPSESF